jgi:hypothetical protein
MPRCLATKYANQKGISPGPGDIERIGTIFAASEKYEKHVCRSDRNPAVKEDLTLRWNLENDAPW